MTKKAADSTTNPPTGDKPFTIATLGLDLLDTTWRIIVPVIIFALLGIFADIQLDTKPWMTMLGVVIGFVFAGLLIKKLLNTIQR
ncbi:MAG TPA: AtpZ/AtpI family protein [Candidatus Saccharimonadales bacterium]|nr:AtpZ/AtpI family protein [Candidatus Saccharimonadales bacterium]